MARPVLLLVDGNNLVHRAYHALPPLTISKSGEMVNAVFGFASSLLKVLAEIKPEYCGVAFDKGRSFRRDDFAAYKAQRKKADEELTSQWPRVRQLVDAFGMPVFEVEGYEADDLLGTLARQATERGIDTVLFTGDKDALQLVTDQVKVLMPGRTLGDVSLYDIAGVREKMGVGPEQVTDLKGLMGDSSDNIPGVPGVGEKTASKLIQQFGSIEEVYRRLDQVTPPRLQRILSEHRHEAEQSKALTTIVKDIPVDLVLHECGSGGYDRLIVLFRELEFLALINRIPRNAAASGLQNKDEHLFQLPTQTTAMVPVAGRTVKTTVELEEMLQRLSNANTLALEIEATGTSGMSAEIVGIALAACPGQAFYLPMAHRVLDEQLPMRQSLERLKPMLQDAGLPKAGHNIKFAALVLPRYGVELENVAFDTMIAAHLMGEKTLTLKGLAFQRLNLEISTAADLCGKGAKQVSLANMALDKTTEAACVDADVTLRLMEVLGEELRRDEELEKLFREVEMPLLPVLLHMERRGVALNVSLLEEMARNMGSDLRRLEEETYRNVGHQFNMNSPQQLSHILFEELQLSHPRRTHGGYSTDAAVLEGLRGAHTVIDNILEYRQLSKLKSTYLDALPALVNPATGRVHTSFNQTGTSTGRLSSSEPNLQNIPVRGELGRRIRHAFIAPEGCDLLAGDYSQIDLRVLAHFSHDESLMSAFQRGEDVHTSTAAAVYGVSPMEVTSEMRRLAKTVNFGVVYGMSEFGLEQATDLSREQAGEFIRAYFEKYPKVLDYLEATRKRAREKGYVQTLLGRRRYVPEVRSPNRQIREGAERMAINMPVQGTSADIIKVAMIEIYRRIRQKGLKTNMTLQVHDELIFETPHDELEEMEAMLRDVMPNAVKLSVPVAVDLKTGSNWGEME